MHKLNPWVYDSLLELLDAVHLYRAYRQLDTSLSSYLYYELLIALNRHEMYSFWKLYFEELHWFRNKMQNAQVAQPYG